MHTIENLLASTAELPETERQYILRNSYLKTAALGNLETADELRLHIDEKNLGQVTHLAISNASRRLGESVGYSNLFLNFFYQTLLPEEIGHLPAVPISASDEFGRVYVPRRRIIIRYTANKAEYLEIKPRIEELFARFENKDAQTLADQKPMLQRLTTALKAAEQRVDSLTRDSITDSRIEKYRMTLQNGLLYPEYLKWNQEKRMLATLQQKVGLMISDPFAYRISQLGRMLEAAVKIDDFEKAALLRDELNVLRARIS